MTTQLKISNCLKESLDLLRRHLREAGFAPMATALPLRSVPCHLLGECFTQGPAPSSLAGCVPARKAGSEAVRSRSLLTRPTQDYQH